MSTPYLSSHPNIADQKYQCQEYLLLAQLTPNWQCSESTSENVKFWGACPQTPLVIHLQLVTFPPPQLKTLYQTLSHSV